MQTKSFNVIRPSNSTNPIVMHQEIFELHNYVIAHIKWIVMLYSVKKSFLGNNMYFQALRVYKEYQ